MLLPSSGSKRRKKRKKKKKKKKRKKEDAQQREGEEAKEEQNYDADGLDEFPGADGEWEEKAEDQPPAKRCRHHVKNMLILDVWGSG